MGVSLMAEYFVCFLKADPSYSLQFTALFSSSFFNSPSNIAWMSKNEWWDEQLLPLISSFSSQSFS